MTTYVPERRVRRRLYLDPWVVAAIVLAAALVGLSTWVVVDRTGSSSTPGLASSEVATMLSDRLAALNSGDAEAISAFYSPDAVLEERDVTPAAVTRGSGKIGERIAGIVQMFGLQLEPASPVIRLGSAVAEATSVSGYTDEGFILVYQLDANGKIAYQWVLPAPPR